jgi:hypothetical protein
MITWEYSFSCKEHVSSYALSFSSLTKEFVSLHQTALWHADSLLGNDREIKGKEEVK